MRDRPSVCSGNVSKFHQGPPLLGLEGRLDNHGLSGTTAQDDPPTGRHAKPCRMRGNCITEDEPGTTSYCMFAQPDRSLSRFGAVRQTC
jgi:hypothetical protein